MMSDNNRDLLGNGNKPQNELLDEPVEPVEVTLPANTQSTSEHPPSHITTVAEYFRWKAEQEAAEQPADVAREEEENVEEALPLLNEVVTPDELNRFVDTKDIEEESIPILDEIVDAEENIPLTGTALPVGHEESPAMMSRSEIDELVGFIVERKLQHLKTQLEQEVLEELRRILPQDLVP